MRREYMITIPGVILAMALLAPVALAQFTVSGTVRNQSSVPVAGVGIRLFDGNDNPIGIPPIATDGAGFYAINGLPSGQYVVQFDPPVATRLLAVQQPVAISGASTTLNVNLQPGNLLSGHVRDGNGVGIAGIDLQVVDRDTGDPVLTPGDDTDANGFYDVVVPSGEFDLEWRAVGAGSLPWIPVAMREVIDSDTTIDVTMVIGFFVTGTVRNAGGTPIPNVNMDFVDAATGVKLDTPGDNTNAAGFYEVQVPAGVYVVRAKPQPQYRLVAGELSDVVVTVDTAGVDFDLQPGVVLSGRVTRASGGGGVANVDVDANDAATGADIFLAFDATDALGFYEVIVPPGLLEITYEPAVATSLAPHRTAPMNIVSDTVHNVALLTGVQFSGTVRNHLGAGIGNVDIDVLDAATGVSVPLVGDKTDAAGAFLTIVAPGVYHLEFEPPKVLGLVAEQRLNQTINANTAVNVSLQPGARITGTVTDQGGLPVSGVDIDAFVLPANTEVFTPADRTDALGQYEIIIPPATYRLLFVPGLGSPELDPLEIASVVVTGDQVIDVQLPNAGGVGVDDGVPDEALLRGLRNFPNPFNPATVISFDLSRPARVSLGVYTVAGDLVAVLRDGELAGGPHAVTWQGRDAAGRAVPSGVYVFRLVTDETVATGKMLLTK